MHCHFSRGLLLWLAAVAIMTGPLARAAEELPLPLVYAEDFEDGAKNWQPTDELAWKVKQTGSTKVYSQFKKRSQYEPPHRSPYNISLLKDIYVSDFDLHVKVKSTHPDYGHRDVCLFFGYQNPSQFHYVHLGKQADEHANQIFIVNNNPRTKISITSTDGTDWDDAWHQVKIVRRVADGTIKVYFDDMDQPVMTAKDKSLIWGRIGLGSFDDTADFDDLRLFGKKLDKPQ